MRHWRWSPATLNPHGRLSSNAMEFYGGPFFTDDGGFNPILIELLLILELGRFVHDDLIPHARKLEDEVPECILEEKQVNTFLTFMRRMLCWVPEERATAAELLSDPWLQVSTT